MNAVLSVASECAPLVKTGGLADVVGALPGALAPTGWTLRTLLPGYPDVLAQLVTAAPIRQWDDLFGGSARVFEHRAGTLDLLILDAPHLFGHKGNIYLGPDGRDWPDNPERFAALSRVAAEIGAGALGGWRPDVIHCHDWQAALAPTYLKAMGKDMPTVLTIHNIAFHGLAPADRLGKLGLPADRFHREGFEFWGQISALKAGLVDAWAVTTVSPTYARELATPAFGMGMEGVIDARGTAVTGILNGIDTQVWDPASDPAVTPFSSPRGKARNRARLVDEFGLEDAPGPLCAVVSRLTGQKGLDLLLDTAARLTGLGGQLALLGSGDTGLEDAFRDLAATNPRVGVRIGYDEALSHLMYAGADAVLVPSRFEPCGLTQLYALRYGAIPVVARTGGLADTVVDANEAAIRAGVATGIQFSPTTADALAAALERLVRLYADKPVWGRMRRRAMAHPVGWDVSARSYADLYHSLVVGEGSAHDS